MQQESVVAILGRWNAILEPTELVMFRVTGRAEVAGNEVIDGETLSGDDRRGADIVWAESREGAAA